MAWQVRHRREKGRDREVENGLIAEFQPHITSNATALPRCCQKSSASLETQLLTFVKRRFSGLVGDVGLGPSLQQGEQAVQVAPAGGQVESCLLVERALVDCAGVCCEERASPESLRHVVSAQVYAAPSPVKILGVLGEFLLLISSFLFLVHEQSKLRIYYKVSVTQIKYLNQSLAQIKVFSYGH